MPPRDRQVLYIAPVAASKESQVTACSNLCNIKLYIVNYIYKLYIVFMLTNLHKPTHPPI